MFWGLLLLQAQESFVRTPRGGVWSPTTAGFIGSFQFCSKTSVANKSASFLAAGTDFLVAICKYHKVVCIKAASQKEFPPKKHKRGEKKILALDQRLGTKMASMHHTCGALCAGAVFTPLWWWGFSSAPHRFLFNFTSSYRLCCVTSANFFFSPINDYITVPSHWSYHIITH